MGISGELCLAYLDDVIVFSATFKEHLQRLATVLQRLQAANLKLKPAKCHLFRILGAHYLKQWYPGRSKKDNCLI